MMTQTDPLRPGSGGPGDDKPHDGHQEARDRAAEVAHDAGNEARSVADTAQHEASRVTDEVRAQAINLTESVRGQLHDQARTQTDHLGQAIDGMGDRIQALADGRPEDAGNVQELAQSIADQVKNVSSRIDELGFDGAVDELQRYARRRPGAFLAGAAVLGFAAARVTQGAQSADDDDAASGSNTGTTGQRTGHQTDRHQPAIGDREAALPPPLPVEEGRPPVRDRGPVVLPETADERIR